MKILFLTNNLDVSKPLYDFLSKQNDIEISLSDQKFTAEELELRKPDLIISYNYSHLITEDIIRTMKENIINLHASYLPFNRGADPNIWSILEGTPSGITIHLVDKGLDTGKILYQKECNLSQDSTLRSSYNLLHKNIQKLFIGNWDKIRNFDFDLKEQVGVGTFHFAKQFKECSEILGEERYDLGIMEFKDRYKKWKKDRDED